MRRKLILIAAPAGFGKSTLAAEWCALLEREQAPIAWVSLDANDQDPVRFWLHLFSALEGALPGSTGEALAMLRSAPPAPAESVLMAALNALAEVEQELFLLLDDYHLIESEDVHNGVRSLLEHLPPSLHLVILTRSDPPLALARMRARGELLELRAQDLRFSEAEAAALLQSLPGVAIGPELVGALAARIEGWAAGLQLAALSLQGRADAASFVEAFVSNHHYLVDYLVEEILLSQPEPVQRFLLDTSVLERISGPLAEAVSGVAGGRAILEMLEQRGLFTVALDAERQWFRYHQLFADILRSHLIHAEPERVPELHRRAAAWFADRGMAQEAIRAALAAGDFDLAATLIAAAAESLWQSGQIEQLRAWLGAIPQDVLAGRPALLIQRARIGLLVDGEADGPKQFLAEAQAGLAAIDDPWLAAQAATLEGAIARVEGDLAQAIALGQQALAVFGPDEGLWSPLASITLALAYQQQGELEDALPILRDSIQRSRRAGDLFTAVAQYGVLGEIERALGRLHQAEASYQQALELVAAHGGQVRSVGLIHAGLGAIYYEWNQVERAQAELERGRELGLRWGHFDSVWRSSKALTNLYLAQGRAEAIRSAGYLSFMSTARRFNAVAVAGSLAQLGYLHLLEGDLTEAVRLAEHVGEALENGLGSAWWEALLPARVLLAVGREAEGLAHLRRLLALVEGNGQVDGVIRTQALLAVALEQGGDREGALTALGQALALGERERYQRTFIDEGAAMRRLLEAARLRGIAAAYVGQLLGEAAVAARPSAPVVAPLLPDLLTPLSERELEVLRLAATGLSNQEIGAQIFITAGTVKNHLHNIMGKLDVSNRLQAINKARELGLL